MQRYYLVKPHKNSVFVFVFLLGCVHEFLMNLALGERQVLTHYCKGWFYFTEYQFNNINALQMSSFQMLGIYSIAIMTLKWKTLINRRNRWISTL